MGLFDAAGAVDPNTGLLGSGMSPQMFGLALMANSAPSRMPHTFLSDIGKAGLEAQSAQGEQLRNALLGQQAQTGAINQQMLRQRYQMMQDALGGTGSFGAQAQGQPQAAPPPGGAPDASGAPPSPDGGGGGGLLGGGQAPPQGGLLGGAGGGGAGGPAPPSAGGIPPDLYRRALIAEALIPGSGKALIEKNMPGFENMREGSVVMGPDGKPFAQNPKIPPNNYLGQDAQGRPSALPVAGAAGAQLTNDRIPLQAKAESEFGVSPNGGPGAPPPTSPPLVSSGVPLDHPVITNKGTIVPPAKGNQVMGPGTDLIGKQNTESINTEKGWSIARPAIETQGARLQVISNAFSNLDTKGLTQSRADIANALNGVGLKVIGDQVMSQANVADVQRVLWAGMQDVMSQLKAANAGTGGRILRAEFEAYMDHAFSPDQVGPALRTAVTQQLGTLYQNRNMIDDYHSLGRQNGWRDANQFQNAYLQKNPIDGFVNYAEKSVPPFKGADAVPNTPKSLSGTPGLQYSPSRKQFKDATGKIYDSLGNEVK